MYCHLFYGSEFRVGLELSVRVHTVAWR